MIKLSIKFKLAMLAYLFTIFVFGIFNFVEDNKIWRAENAKAATSCKGPADVILVIDRSADMANSSKFSAAKSASVNFIDKLFATVPDPSYVGCDYHQVGLIAFNISVDSESLNETGNIIQSIINQSDGILGSSYPSDYRDETAAAIGIAKNKLVNSGNSCATKTMIVLTDGAPRSDIVLARAQADDAKTNKGIRIISVGLKLDKIADPTKKTEAEDFIRYISSTPSDCYYVSDPENTLENCTSISAADLEVALNEVYIDITAAVCDESPPSIEIYRTPQNTLYSVDKLVIKSVATDDIGFESHTLRWSDNWANPGDIIEIACGNLSGTVIECSTEELGPFSVGDIISYRSIAKDANGNEASIDLPDPRSVTVANVSLNVPALFRNTNNGISVTISDPNGKADLDSFYITVDAPILADVEIEKAAMSCSGSGSSWICTYNFNTANFGDGCLDWTNGITDGKANDININVYVYADSGDMEIRQIASAENQPLFSHYEGISYSGTCSDGINNDCDYDISNNPIIDAEEMSCDAGNPLVGISRVPSGDVYDDDSVTFTSGATDSNGIKQHTIYYKKEGDVDWIKFDCVDEDPDDGKIICDGVEISQSIVNISTTVGSFAPGIIVEYYSTAVDYSGNNNIGNSTTESFIVRNRECEGVGDLGDCLVTENAKCCGEVCNAIISNPNSYNADFCAQEICDGISWEWGAANDTVICSASGNATECHSFSALYGPPPGVPPYFFDGGCEERDYTCSSGYCTYGVTNRNEDHCIGGGSLMLNDYECVGNFCQLNPNPAVKNDICDLDLDHLSVNAYNSNSVFICGSSGAATGEVLDNLTNNISLQAITYDENGISEQKIYWKEITEADYNINNCNVNSCGDVLDPCDCSQDIGSFNVGDIIEFYALSKDDSPNQTKNIAGPAGLRYYYYDGTNFNTYLGSDIDTDIDHDWGSGQVNINGNSWENQSSTVSIIWDGMIAPDVLGVHTFYLYSDDGIRFDIDGDRLIDHWGYSGSEYSATYDFISLEPVSIRIEWYEGWGGANLRLGWESPSGVKTYPIPSGNLIAPYSFTVRDGECYDIPGGDKPNLTSCDSGNGMCCGGSCDSSVSSTSFDEGCYVNSCNGTNWVYAVSNEFGDTKEGDLCGSTDSCFNYYSPNNSFYSGCITGGNKCSSGYCAVSSSLTSIPACNGNLLTNYNCDPDNATGTCQPKDSNIDCSVIGNYDSDSVDCNCDCDGYDIEEKVYSSLSFDGMGDYVEIPDNNDSLDLGDYFTISLWMKKTQDANALIINKGGSWDSNLRWYLATSPAGNFIEFGIDTTDKLYGTVDVIDGMWHFVTATYENGSGTLYVDGILDNSESGWELGSPNDLGIYIGAWANGDYPTKGSIDSVRIYNRALYPEEIQDHYNGIFADNTGLVGHWDFDEGTGETVEDSSGNGNDGSLNNIDGVLGSGSYSPSWTSGKYGSGLDFDGDDYVALNNLGLSTATDSKVSVEFWMNWNGGNSQMPFGWNSYDLWLYDGSFGFNTFADDIWGISSSGLSNKWIHIIAVFNNGDAKLSELYLNGSKQSLSQRRGSTGNGTVSSNARISGYSGGSDYRFNGLLDEIRIYDRALSETEAEEHYKGVFVNNSNLVGHWNFNENSGTIAYDSSENGPVWMKHYHDSSENNVPINWQVCADGKNNDCDEVADDYDNEGATGISNCDGEVDGVYVTARAKNSEGVENSNLFSSGLGITIYDVDIERDSNDFTISSYGTTDEFLIQQTIIEWTTDNWANKDNKVCSGGTCKVCVGSAYSETGVAESGGNKILIDNDKSWTADEWQNFVVKIISGTGAGQIRTIVSNTDVQLTVDIDWTAYPDTTSEYQISKCENESIGTATELGGSKTLTSNTKLWINNEWTGGTIEIISGTGVGQIRNIISNIEDKITVGSDWGTLPDTDSQYRISKKGDVISSSSLSAGNTFNFRVCARDSSINNNKKCTDYHGIIILSSNLVPEITPLSVQEPNFCAGLSYVLNWEFSDPDDGQDHYEIQIKEGDNNFDSGSLIVDTLKNSGEDNYIIDSSDFIDGNKIEYGKTYYWRVKATDDRSGGYEQTTEWIAYDDPGDPDGDGNSKTFTTPNYKYPQVDFSATPNHTIPACLYEFGHPAESKCDFGEDITFFNNSDFIECINSGQCLTASAAKCDTVDNKCVSCGGNDECVKFDSPNVIYSCNIESGVCEASGSCLADGDCKAANAAKCDIDSGSCVFCDDDLQCTNDKFETIGVDYVCNDNGKCEDKEHRKWYFYNDLYIDSNDPNPVNNYIDSSQDVYPIILKIKDILGKSCYEEKNIFLDGSKNPKWNEMPPSGN